MTHYLNVSSVETLKSVRPCIWDKLSNIVGNNFSLTVSNNPVRDNLSILVDIAIQENIKVHIADEYWKNETLILNALLKVENE